jgi:hypothetical protein
VLQPARIKLSQTLLSFIVQGNPFPHPGWIGDTRGVMPRQGVPQNARERRGKKAKRELLERPMGFLLSP